MKNHQNVFKIKNGKFSYGKTTIFDDLNISFQQKKFYGLIGPNGSGKSTMINLLMATSKLQSGTITYRSTPLELFSRRQLAKHLALVPQNITVGFDYSVHDIVLMGRHPHIPRFSPPSGKDLQIVSRALKLLDIEHLKERPVTQLSGGEKQRVIVARALAQETEVLALDEATSNLDIEHTLEIMRILRNLVDVEDTTVIAAIHDLNLAAAFCDDLIVLNNRTVYDSGPVKAVLTTDLLNDVFSVKASVSSSAIHNYPRIEYDMFNR